MWVRGARLQSALPHPARKEKAWTIQQVCYTASAVKTLGSVQSSRLAWLVITACFRSEGSLRRPRVSCVLRYTPGKEDQGGELDIKSASSALLRIAYTVLRRWTVQSARFGLLFESRTKQEEIEETSHTTTAHGEVQTSNVLLHCLRYASQDWWYFRFQSP